MTRDELIEYQRREKQFSTTEVGSAFLKFKNRLSDACRADARLEFLDQGDIAARKAWSSADLAEREFRTILERMIALPATEEGGS